MNGKFIFVFFIATSLICSLLSTQMCATYTTTNPGVQLYNLITINSVAALKQTSCTTGGEQIVQSSQLNLTDNFSSVLGQTTDKNTGVASNALGFSFVDVVKLLLTLITALLGIPILVFFYSIGTPTVIYVLVVIPVFTIYLISLMEFLGARSL